MYKFCKHLKEMLAVTMPSNCWMKCMTTALSAPTHSAAGKSTNQTNLLQHYMESTKKAGKNPTALKQNMVTL